MAAPSEFYETTYNDRLIKSKYVANSLEPMKINYLQEFLLQLHYTVQRIVTFYYPGNVYKIFFFQKVFY